MKDIKINYSRYLGLGTLVLTGLLQACGGEEPNYNDPRYANNYYQNSAGCSIPVGVKDRTVTGVFGTGATLKLDIFTQPGGTIAAYGELSVPSVEALFGVNVFNGQFGNDTSIAGYGYTGPNSQFRTCVSSNGFAGSLTRDRSYQDISIALVGNGNTYIEMGNVPGQTYLVGDYVEGTIKMRVGSYPDMQFILAH
jgi:hypothetical protein